VTHNIAPSVLVIKNPTSLLTTAGEMKKIEVRIAAGTLPSPKIKATFILIEPSLPRKRVALAFVIPAYKRSVPTATAGGKPKPIINKGVISEPPPTPDRPMINPTSNPLRTK